MQRKFSPYIENDGGHMASDVYFRSTPLERMGHRLSINIRDAYAAVTVSPFGQSTNHDELFHQALHRPGAFYMAIFKWDSGRPTKFCQLDCVVCDPNENKL